ncbi:hypothetical protein J6590_066085 [Homalodisca vitripennis]|nr:hypothetical protein J6590_066085 [Homalodisca vitripennis]
MCWREIGFRCIRGHIKQRGQRNKREREAVSKSRPIYGQIDRIPPVMPSAMALPQAKSVTVTTNGGRRAACKDMIAQRSSIKVAATLDVA